MADNYSLESINFYDDKLNATRCDGEAYVVARDILKNIGFDVTKINNQVTSWANDAVIKRGIKSISVLTNGGPQKCICLKENFVPLALAKISVTQTMLNSHPEITAKLIRYQLECGTVLYKYFHTAKRIDPDLPLSREEMAMYYSHLTKSLESYCNVLAKRDQSRDKFVTEILQAQSDAISQISATLKSLSVNNVANAVIENKATTEIENKTDIKANNTSFDNPEYYEWKKIAKAACAKAAPILGYKDYKYTIGYIVEQMRLEFPDFDERYKNFKENSPRNSASKITMISMSEAFRSSFDKHLDNIFSGKVGLVAKGCISKTKTPDSFKSVLSKLGTPSPRLYEKVYRRMERDFGINLDDIRKAAEEKYGTKCSTAYAIVADNGVNEIFLKAVDSLMNEVA